MDAFGKPTRETNIGKMHWSNQNLWLEELNSPPAFNNRILQHVDEMKAIQRVLQKQMAETVSLILKEQAPGHQDPESQSHPDSESHRSPGI